MELKPQDLLVVLKAAAHPGQRWTYTTLADASSMSPSEVHASVKRAMISGLASVRGRDDWSPILPALLEFAEHGALCLAGSFGSHQTRCAHRIRCRATRRQDYGLAR